MKFKVGLVAFSVVLFFMFLFFQFLSPVKKSVEKKSIEKEVVRTIDIREPVVPVRVDFLKKTTAKSDVPLVKGDRVVFGLNGILLKGEVEYRPLTEFKKGQLLFRIDNRDFFIEIAAKKSELLELVDKLTVEIETFSSTELEDWKTFKVCLQLNKLLPEFPVLQSDKIVQLAGYDVVKKMYLFVKNMEREMGNYFFIAPYDGYFSKSIVKDGSRIKKNQTIALIEKIQN